MYTEVLAVDPVHPDPSTIERAAALLRAGEVLVFPTETVYGLGAAALQPGAVERIFAANGRPLNDPLIVHIAEEDALQQLTSAMPAPPQLLPRAVLPRPFS